MLERAGIVDLLDVIFDGRDLETENLPGKPRPDAFLRAAERLGWRRLRVPWSRMPSRGLQPDRPGASGW